VAASLKEKLKALIFIPIVSRTYCDPNSYAWEHEFIAFIEQASQDRFGLKVKLPGGNVASRVLPVRIHDLEPEDIKLAESYLGFIRPVDFIYHSQGVNRPLRLKDDDLAKPGQQLVYRDQINKVANAVREIINGLKMGVTATEKVMDQPTRPLGEDSSVRKVGEGKEREKRENKPASGFRRKPWIWAASICILLIIAAILAYPKISHRNTLQKLEESGRIRIAVMPFEDHSKGGSANNNQGIVQALLIAGLRQCHDSLKVPGRENINQYLQDQGLAGNVLITKEDVDKVSRSLGADATITGSIVPLGDDSLQIIAFLNYSESAEDTKTYQRNAKVSEINPSVTFLSMTIGNYLVIDILKKKLPMEFRPLLSTSSPKALSYFILGNDAFYKYQLQTAVENYSNAISQDSNFTIARIMWSFAYYEQSGGKWRHHDKEKEEWQKLYEKGGQLSPLDRAWTSWLHTRLFDETPNKQVDAIKAILKIDDQSPFLYNSLGLVYLVGLKEYDLAIPAFRKAIDISKKWGSKPRLEYFTRLGNAYHSNFQYEDEEKLYRQALRDFPNNPDIISKQARLLWAKGDTVKGIKYMEGKFKSSLGDSLSEAEKLHIIADAFKYSFNLPDQAEKYLRQAIDKEPNPVWIKDLAFQLWNDDKNQIEAEKYFRLAPENRLFLAWFLIDTGRDVTKGLEIVEEEWKKSNGSFGGGEYNVMDTKGWGLHKLGKNEEALEWLKKSQRLMPEDNPNADSINQHVKIVEEALKNQKKK
jgi:tetratricopeptide (TPR) repeat protein